MFVMRKKLALLLNRLHSNRLLSFDSPGQFQLTVSGIEIGERVLRNHLLWEIYLSKYTPLAGTTLSALLPLILTFAGALFKEMAGTVLGTIKVAIPLGGIITPFLMALIAVNVSTQASLIIFPLSLLIGLLLVLWVVRLEKQPREPNATKGS